MNMNWLNIKYIGRAGLIIILYSLPVQVQLLVKQIQLSIHISAIHYILQ